MIIKVIQNSIRNIHRLVFVLKLVCADGIDYEQEPIIDTKISNDDDVVELFVETIEKEIKNFYNRFKFPKIMKFGEKEKKLFKDSTHCHICDKIFKEKKNICSECNGTAFFSHKDKIICENVI